VETEAVPVERVRLTTAEQTDEETVRGQVRKEEIDTEGVDEDRRARYSSPHRPRAATRQTRRGARQVSSTATSRRCLRQWTSGGREGVGKSTGTEKESVVMTQVEQPLTDAAIKVRQVNHYQFSWVAGEPGQRGTFTLQLVLDEGAGEEVLTVDADDADVLKDLLEHNQTVQYDVPRHTLMFGVTPAGS
jgi:hypothetical protein